MGMLKNLILPSGFIAICFLIGFFVIYLKNYRKVGIGFLMVGAALYVVLSIGPVSHALLRPFEFKYEAYDPTALDTSSARYIVIMAGYALDESYYPISSKVNDASLFRIVEAYQLWRLDKTRRIIISGDAKVPQIMMSVLESMGVAKESIILDNQSDSTWDSSVNIGSYVQDQKFLLVTSAGHMPRAMSSFKKLNLNPLPVPTDYKAGKELFKARFFPSVEYLYYSELAFHEFFGIIWQRVMNLFR